MLLTVAELSEQALLARFIPLLGATPRALVGPGDDSAVVAAPDARFTVSTDVLVEDHHFRRAWSSGADIGWRAIMQNLADAAAMGAQPTSVVVALVLPPTTAVAWVEDLARGMAAACSKYGVEIVGGDLSAGPVIVVAVTVHGDLQGRDPVLRSGASVGDQVIHAGLRGWSAAGLMSLEQGRDATDRVLAPVIGAFVRPDPPIASGVVAARAGATAMIDLSDGLVRDAGRIAAASGVTIDLLDPLAAFLSDVSELRVVAHVLSAGPDGHDDLVRHWLLAGGEDHGMLATLPPDAIVPPGFTRIGRVVSAASPPTGEPGQDSPPLVTVEGEVPAAQSGWDHFRSA